MTYAEARDRRNLKIQSAILQLLAGRGPMWAADLTVALSAAGLRMGIQGWSSAAHLRELRRDGLVERGAGGRWSLVAERCAGLAPGPVGGSVPAWETEEWGVVG